MRLIAINTFGQISNIDIHSQSREDRWTYKYIKEREQNVFYNIEN